MKIKIWADPVWSKVIAAIILLLLSSVGTYLLGIWPSIIQYSKNGYEFLNSSNAVKNWLIGIALIPWLLIAFFICAVIAEKFRKKEPKLNWHSYMADNFFGLNWKWSYSNNNIANLNAFCPQCHYQIFPRGVVSFIEITYYKYDCEDCGYCSNSTASSPQELEQKVKLKIQKNIRTEEWLKK